MTESTNPQNVQATLNRAEAQLQQLGPGLQFLVTPEGEVEIVRRAAGGETAEPKEVVARLAGCDPALWQAEHAAGPITLGRAYREARPRCALSGAIIVDRAPIELYYRGRPVSAEKALRIDPLPALVRGLVMAGVSVLAELGGAASQLGEIDNQELRGIVAERLVKELAGRLGRGFAGVPLVEGGGISVGSARAEELDPGSRV